jgi:hypothetical protein
MVRLGTKGTVWPVMCIMWGLNGGDGGMEVGVKCKRVGMLEVPPLIPVKVFVFVPPPPPPPPVKCL